MNYWFLRYSETERIMSKVALITDLHCGWKNDSRVFLDYFLKFFDTVFFPELEKRDIKDIIMLGDFWDRRKYVNFHTLYTVRERLLEKLIKYNNHFIIGNHDTSFRDTNAVNSIRELCSHYPNLNIYEEPEEVTIGGRRMLFVPWLNPLNMGPGLEMVKNSKAQVLMGHLEIAGFHYDRATLCQHGLDKSIFNKFKHVFSGHFHTQSKDGNIHYLGSPYEMTFADVGDDRGFHIFDTNTLDLEFIQNPYRMFHRITYDDRDTSKHTSLLTEDFSGYEGTQVKVLVHHKTDPYLYERWLTRLEEANPDSLQPIETFSLEIDESVDEQFGNFEQGEVLLTDTLQVLFSYVDGIQIELDKDRMKNLVQELYMMAQKVSG